MIKHIAVLSLALFVSGVGFVAADDAWVVANETVQVDEQELRTITKALLKSGQIPEDNLSVAYVEKAAKEFMLYKALAAQASELGLDSTSEALKLVEMSQQRILGSIYIADFLDKLELPDFEKIALENYLLNKKQFIQSETVSAQHILIRFNDDEKKAQQLAVEVRAIAVNGDKDFSELAKRYSQDSSVTKNNGNLGYFEKNKMVPEFSEAAFSLKINEISQPVKTQYGWHIIKVLDKKPVKMLEFNDVKDGLISKAKQSFIEKARNNKLKETVYTPGLTVNEDLIKKVTNDLLKKN